MGIFNVDALKGTLESATPAVNDFIDKTLLEQYYSAGVEAPKKLQKTRFKAKNGYPYPKVVPSFSKLRIALTKFRNGHERTDRQVLPSIFGPFFELKSAKFPG